MIRVLSDKREERYKVCKDCESYKLGHVLLGADKCVECGCVMELKTWLEAAKCPKSKW